jgi:hypothetical protein
MQVADFLQDIDMIGAVARTLAHECSRAKWEDAAWLREQLLELPRHLQQMVFTHLLSLVPLNKLLTAFPCDLLQPLTAALVSASCADVGSEPAGEPSTTTPPHSTLELPAPAPGMRPRWGAAALKPAAYYSLFWQITMLTPLMAINLKGHKLQDQGVMAAIMALRNHVHLTRLDLRNHGSDDFGLRIVSDALPRWPGLRVLLLSGNQLLRYGTADVLAPGLRALTQLTWLDVRSVCMTDALRAALAQLTAMQRLELGTPHVNDALIGMVCTSATSISAEQTSHLGMMWHWMKTRWASSQSTCACTRHCAGSALPTPAVRWKTSHSHSGRCCSTLTWQASAIAALNTPSPRAGFPSCRASRQRRQIAAAGQDCTASRSSHS